MMNQMAGVKMEHIPFRGTPAAIAALLGKQVDLVMELIQTVRGHVEAGELKAIAVTSPQRFPAVPQLPTFAGSRLPRFPVAILDIPSLAAGTPPALVLQRTRD